MATGGLTPRSDGNEAAKQPKGGSEATETRQRSDGKEAAMEQREAAMEQREAAYSLRCTTGD